jgi:IstB-like ATP binding protein
MTAHSLKVADPFRRAKSLRVGRIQLQEPVPLPDSWGKIFDDPMVAAAMLDRLLHRSVVFNIDGDSYRMRAHRARSENLRKGVKSTAEK